MLEVDPILDALWTDINTLQAEMGPPDLVCFTGDLVQQGDLEDDFDLAISRFILPLEEITGLGDDRIFIVAGNHDVSRSKVSVPMLERWNKLRDDGVDAIREYLGELKEPPASLATVLSLADMAHPRWVHPLTYTAQVPLNGIRLGIAGVTSPWASAAQREHGRLMLGDLQLEIAERDLRETDVKIALFHHPIEWLLDEDRQAVEVALAKYTIVLNGHLHQVGEKTILRQDRRTVYSSAGAIYAPRDPSLDGYTWLQLDWPDCVTLHLREYSRSRKQFVKAESWVSGGQVRRNLHSDSGAQMLLPRAEDVTRALDERDRMIPILRSIFPAAKVTLPGLFVAPELQTPEAYVERNLYTRGDYAKLDDVLKGNVNVVFVGSTESGKTTLLKYLAVRALEENRLPVFVDFEKIGPTTLSSVLDRSSTWFGGHLSRRTIDAALSNGAACILVDNLDGSNKAGMQVLQEMAKRWPQNRWFVTMREGIWQSFGLRSLPEMEIIFEAYYLRPITRGKIREFVERFFSLQLLPSWPNANSATAELVEYLGETGFARTPYNLIVLLTLLGSRHAANPINEAAFLRRYMELILERGVADEARIGSYVFDDKESFLAVVAESLLDQGGHMAESEFEILLSDWHQRFGYLVRKSRFDRLFLEKGVLVVEGSRVTFRDHRIWSYYLAVRATKSAQLLDRLMDPAHIREFGDVLALYAGLRHDAVFLVEHVERLLLQVLDECVRTLPVLRIGNLGPQLPFRREDLDGLLVQLHKRSAEEADQAVDAVEERLQTSPTGDGKDAPELPLELHNLLGLHLLYGRLLRNTPEMDVNQKVSSLKLYLTAGTVAWIILGTIIQKYLDDGVITAEWVPFEQRGRFVKLVGRIARVLVPLLVQRTMAGRVATPKLHSILQMLWDEGVPDDAEELSRFLLFGLLYDLGADSRIDVVRAFIRSAPNDLVELAMYKLLGVIASPDVDESEKTQLTPFIVEASKRSLDLSVREQDVLRNEIRRQVLMDRVRVALDRQNIES